MDSLGPPALHAMCFFSVFKVFFNVDHLKVFIEFVTILLLFYALVLWPRGV